MSTDFGVTEMFRLVYLLLLGQVVFGSFSEGYLRSNDLEDEDYDEDALLKEQEIIDKNLEAIIHAKTKEAGYPLEEHTVVTEDGYVLRVHRIPYAPHNKNVKNRPVVFIQHGLLSCSYHWLTQGPGKALGYILADEGFDVWMGNARGNSYSKNHIKLSKRKKEFWNFSWNEIGYYDLPAMIDYALRNTGQDGVNYIGHSQGTTSFFVMTSLRPEYNKKIKAMHALAPVAFMSHMANPFFRVLGPVVALGGSVSKILGSFEVLPSSKLMSTVSAGLCKDSSIVQGLCTNALFLIAGFSYENMNATLLPEIMQTTPAGASVNQVIHYAQGISSGKFRKFDYGLTKNMLTYKSVSPPDYKLSSITAPVHLYYSTNDWLAAVTDVQILASKLPNLVFNKQVPHPKFNHFDFLFGIQVYDLVYADLISNMKKYA